MARFQCIICGCDSYRHEGQPRDDHEREIVHCNNCRHVQIYPMPTVEEDERFYQEDLCAKRAHNETDETVLMKRFEKWAEYCCDSVQNM